MLDHIFTYNELHRNFIYIPETGLLINKKDGSVEGTLSDQGYLIVNYKGASYFLHRIVYFMYHGHLPKNQTDHINRIKTDNRIVNLRDVSSAENKKNTGNSKANTSGVKGVVWNRHDNRWRAMIRYKNKNIHIGYFKNFINAVRARYYAEQKFDYLSSGTPSPAEEYLNYTKKTFFYTNIEFEKTIPKNETIDSEWEFFCYTGKKKIDKLAEEQENSL